MTILLILFILALLAIVVIQIGKVTELAAKIRGQEDTQFQTNNRQANYILAFMVVFLVGVVWSAWKYKNYMLGYGPHEAASAHGGLLDSLFNTTLFFTGLVFVVTHIALFYFAWKYKGQRNRKATFLAHDTRLEIVWTAIPAIVMCFLVIKGLVAWNEVMADVDPTEEYMEIEATGAQFLWYIRYPGADGKLGTRDYKMINGSNPLGQDWTDTKNLDDLQPTEIVLPKGKKVRVRITARDVLHNFYLPHFRLKMDAVPGMPTYFVFTPEKTTEEYRQMLKDYPEYQVPTDPSDPESEPLWKSFNYELACAELCGSGHFSMKKIVRIVEQDEYDEWVKAQPSYYLSTIRNGDNDPFKGSLLDIEISERAAEFNDKVEKARSEEDLDKRIIRLDYVTFETGSARLTPLSKYELNNLAEVMTKYPTMQIEVAGHTDNTGDADANVELSKSRASAVYNYLTNSGVDSERLTANGYGQTRPIADNGTADGRQENRRTEFKILAK